MPIKDYGVLKCKAIDRQIASAKSEHFQILTNKDNNPHRIAINTKSNEAPSQVLYFADDNFHHAITDAILHKNLKDGFTPLVSEAGGIALDFIRQNLFDTNEMVPLPSRSPGDDDDLNDKLDFFVQQAIQDPSAVIYAFGQHWVDADKPDRYFPEIDPSTGIHDIHLNQGNQEGKYFNDNGIYQDGGLIFHYASKNRWAAVFTAFQSQSFHTDDATGHPIADIDESKKRQPENITPVRIIAAMVNPIGEDVGKEFVILLNKSSKAIDLSGWQIADQLEKKDTLQGITINACDALKILLTGTGAQLSNKGGNITLLNKVGLKIDGVSYTKEDASNEGEVIEL